jgi:hypothetical protein
MPMGLGNLRGRIWGTGVGALLLAAALTPASSAPAPTLDLTVMKDGIPNLSSIEFAWLGGADWMDPPPGTPGHGRIKDDPEHPFVTNNNQGRQVTLRIGDSRDPILKPWAAAQMLASNIEALTGAVDVPFAAQARCWPGGVPGQLIYPAEPFYFIQTPKVVYMIWQRDHMVRRVFMTDKHSENLKPSWFGESIGRYEEDGTFVVDTIGLSTKNSYIDNFRTPHTEKEHVVERFKIAPDGKTLQAIAVVDDPDTFNGTLTMMQVWRKVKNELLETVCAENNNDSLFFNQKLFPIPEADKPDF